MANRSGLRVVGSAFSVASIAIAAEPEAHSESKNPLTLGGQQNIAVGAQAGFYQCQ